MKKWVLGITGGIGSGKTAVANLFAQHQIDVIDADHAARLVVEKGKPALQAIAKHFGSHLLLADGNLDRTALRHAIFNNIEQRHWLEQLLHPLIRQEICHFLENAQSPYAILVSPLLLETTQHELTDRILVIDTTEEIQIARSILRDHTSEQQIRAIMDAQLPRAKRLAYADDVITNDQDQQYLVNQVNHLHQHYLTLC